MGGNYQKLIVWQKANQLAKEIYQLTQHFLKEELYGLTAQLRRAALSIPTNIVEGYARQGKNELKHFLNIALASLAEVEYLLDFSLDIGNFSDEDHKKLQNLRSEVGGLLWNFFHSI